MLKTWWYGRRNNSRPLSTDWVDALMVLSLHSINRGLRLAWYIDRTETLEGIVEVDMRLHAVLSASLIDFIAYCADPDLERLLWVRSGLLVGVRPIRPVVGDPVSHGQLTERYGVIVVQVFPQSRSFTIITAQRTWHDIGSYHAVTLLKELVTG